MRLLLWVAVLLFSVSACGKKAPLRPPEGSVSIVVAL